MQSLTFNGQTEAEIRDATAIELTRSLELAKHPRRPNTRRNILLRTIYRVVLDTDLATLEKVLLTFFGGFSVVAATLDAATITLPPPYIQNYTLALPPWAWSTLLALGVVWHSLGVLLEKPRARRNGALALAAVACALCGALSVRGPVLGSILAFAGLWQVSVAARLTNGCNKPNKKGA